MQRNRCIGLKHWFNRGSAALVIIVVVSTASTSLGEAQTPRYRVTDLGTLTSDGSGQGTAHRLNNQGAVVGDASADGDEVHGFLWLPTTMLGLQPGLHDLNALPSETLLGPSSGRDINENGVVAGQALGDGAAHAFVWQLDQPGVPTKDLGTMSEQPGTESIAYALNNLDPPRVVGATHADLGEELRIWAFDTMLGGDLYRLQQSRGQCGMAHDVNDNFIRYSEVIVGRSYEGTCTFEPDQCVGHHDGTVWGYPVLVRLRDLDHIERRGSQAFGTNANNHFVGWSIPPVAGGCDWVAVFWENVWADATRLPGAGRDSRANAVNDLNELGEIQAVGVNLGSGKAMAWDRDSQQSWHTVELNENISDSCVWHLDEALDVNNDGWIVGKGTHADVQRAFLLTPAGACPADTDGDAQVNFVDLIAVLAGWGDCTDGVLCLTDVNLDCVVDAHDILEMLGAWGECP